MHALHDGHGVVANLREHLCVTRAEFVGREVRLVMLCAATNDGAGAMSALSLLALPFVDHDSCLPESCGVLTLRLNVHDSTSEGALWRHQYFRFATHVSEASAIAPIIGSHNRWGGPS